MKNVKRVLAMVCVILLLAMYGSTLYFALSNHPDANNWFMASLGCTIIVPVLLYAYILVYKYLKEKK